MWMSEFDRKKLVKKITESFRTFGGGKGGSPVAAALVDGSPSFALGVDVRQVVDCIVDNIDINEAAPSTPTIRKYDIERIDGVTDEQKIIRRGVRVESIGPIIKEDLKRWVDSQIADRVGYDMEYVMTDVDSNSHALDPVSLSLPVYIVYRG